MTFWGKLVKLEEPVRINAPHSQRLRITGATLEERTGVTYDFEIQSTKLYCQVGNNTAVAVCSLNMVNEMRTLDLEYTIHEDVVFSVRGPHDIAVSGYFLEYQPPTNAPAVFDVSNCVAAEQPSLELVSTDGYQVTDSDMLYTPEIEFQFTAGSIQDTPLTITTNNNDEQYDTKEAKRRRRKQRKIEKKLWKSNTSLIENLPTATTPTAFPSIVARVNQKRTRANQMPDVVHRENGDFTTLNQQKSKKRRRKNKAKKPSVAADEVSKQDHDIEVSQPSESIQLETLTQGKNESSTQQEAMMAIPLPIFHNPIYEDATVVPSTIKVVNADGDTTQEAFDDQRKYESSTQEVTMAIPLSCYSYSIYKDATVVPSTNKEVIVDGATTREAFDYQRKYQSSTQEVTMATPLSCYSNHKYQDFVVVSSTNKGVNADGDATREAFNGLRNPAVEPTKQDNGARGDKITRMIVCGLAVPAASSVRRSKKKA